MNHRFLNCFLGASLLCASLFSTADELTVGHTSAASVFKDEAVVKLLKAAINRNVTEAKHLIASGVNVNTVAEGGITPLIWLQANNDTDGMEILLNLGADPNKNVPGEVGRLGVGPPVWLAAGAGRMKTLQVLLDHGGNPNLAIGGKSPLIMAISESHLDCAELLLQHGADINYSAGPMSAFFMTMVKAQFGDAIWVLNHGYTHDLPMARRMLATENRRPEQKAMKEEALKIIDRLLAEQRQ